MGKIQREYSKLVQQRELGDHFYAWIDLANRNRRKRQLLYNIIERKNYYDQLEAFGIWKKDAFFKSMVSLVDQMVVQPNNELLLKEVIFSWRRSHQFGKVKHQYEKIADANYEVTLVKKMFSGWKEIAAPDMQKYL